jgi:hypothetical protein
MKKILFLIFVVLFGFSIPSSFSQKIYRTTGGELIFSFADVEQYGNNVPTNMRFTMFFHFSEKIHFDITNNLGFYSGMGIRNVGLITDQENYKIKRRSYMLGVPLAFKLGSFKDNFYVYAGGEYELLFHYKQKLFVDGNKTKSSEWFSNRTNRFLPSVFAGIQFPKGVNLKFKYYLDDFLNKDFSGRDFGVPVSYATYKTQIYYISLSFNLRNKSFKNYNPDNAREVNYANNL